MTTTRTTGDMLLADVLAHPEDDAVRLIYADWLEEHGEPERGEFIRCQVELARTQRPSRPASLRSLTSYELSVEEVQDLSPARERMERRAMELLRFRGREWRERDPVLHIELWKDPDDIEWLVGIEYRRGFVEKVTLSAADWLAHNADILARHPIQAVNFTTYFDVSGCDKLLSLLRKTTPSSDIPASLHDALSLAWPGVTFTLFGGEGADAMLEDSSHE